MNMQRDLKVGLSLGVLVLGVVGALLFRKEDTSTAHKPALKTARQIDERIAERPRTPYMTGDVEFDQDESNHSNTESGTAAANGRPAHAVPPDWLSDDEDPFQVSKNDQGRFDFRHGPDSGKDAIRTVRPRVPSAGTEVAATHAGGQTHVIQSGDSLSQLAGQYLGSQGRFQEIYEANRDVLTDVNRLPVGATIVIPAASKTAHRTQSATTARTAMGQPEKVRSTITDVTTFEPIAPPDATSDAKGKTEAGKTEANQTSATKGSATADAAVAPTPVTRETKKFVTPSRLPFANQNRSAANQSRKNLDPDGEDFLTAKPTASETAGDAAGEPRHYQVKKGDSLAKIATKVYGNPKRAADIFEANRSLLTSPDAVREGQELVLP